jgi:hypothetical protein
LGESIISFGLVAPPHNIGRRLNIELSAKGKKMTEDPTPRRKWTRKPLESKAVTVEGESYLTLAKGSFPAFLGWSYNPEADDPFCLCFEYLDEDGDPETVKLELSEAMAQTWLEKFKTRVPKLPAGCPLTLPTKAPSPADDDGDPNDE